MTWVYRRRARDSTVVAENTGQTVLSQQEGGTHVSDAMLKRYLEFTLTAEDDTDTFSSLR